MTENQYYSSSILSGFKAFLVLSNVSGVCHFQVFELLVDSVSLIIIRHILNNLFSVTEGSGGSICHDGNERSKELKQSKEYFFYVLTATYIIDKNWSLIAHK